MKFVVLLVAIAPPLILFAYGIGKARASWGSEAIWNAFLVGAVSAFAALAVEFALGYLLPLDRNGPVAEAGFTAVLIAAIPEEAVKFFVLVSLAEKHVDVRRLQDLPILGLAVSLGFATLENFFYVISSGGWQMVAALRAITAVPGHGIDGLAMGALLIRARLSERPEDLRLALIVPILLHALYDFPLFAMHKDVARLWFGVMWLAIIAASSFFVITLCNRMLATHCGTSRQFEQIDELVDRRRRRRPDRRAPAGDMGVACQRRRGCFDGNGVEYFPGCLRDRFHPDRFGTTTESSRKARARLRAVMPRGYRRPAIIGP